MKNHFTFEKSRINNYSLKHHFVTFYQKIETIFFVFLSLIFLVVSTINYDFKNKVSYFFVDISLPVVNFVSSPVNIAINLFTDFSELIEAKKENEILRIHNQQLRSKILQTINIHHENSELREMLSFASEHSLNYNVAKVFAQSHELFNRQLIVRSKKGLELRNGSAVILNKSIIGRIIEANKNEARLLLLTDSKSKIPIVVSESRDRGILSGQNDDLMKIEFLPKDHNINVGDMVFTSSDGKSIPSGIFVGLVTKVDKRNVYVSLSQETNNLDVVTIIEYSNF